MKRLNAQQKVALVSFARTTTLLVLITFLVSQSVVYNVYAHPGRTDSSGGHIDHSTGEYHYHHGYSAHSHYDIDNNGVIDCPYDFHDNTSERSTSSPNKKNPYTGNYSATPSPKNNIQNLTTDETEVLTVPTWVYYIFLTQATIGIALLIANKSKKSTISELQRNHEKELKSMHRSYEEKLKKKRATEADLLSIQSQISLAKKDYTEIKSLLAQKREEIDKLNTLHKRIEQTPLDVYYSEDGLPILGRKQAHKPYGAYTVFINAKSSIYHTDYSCASSMSHQEHIFNVINYARPCKKCALGAFDFDNVPDWYSN